MAPLTGVVLLLVMIAAPTARSVDGQAPANGQQARASAARYVGLTGTDGIGHEAKLVSFQDDDTPVIRNRMNGRYCWVVTFTGVEVTGRVDVDEERSVAVANPYVRELTVILDAESGQLLKVHAGDTLMERSLVRSDPGELEMPFREGKESWDGLPSEPPKVSFLEALARTHFGHRAEQVDAVYVLASYNSTDGKWRSRPTWMIAAHSRKPFLPGTPCEQEQPFPVWGWREAIDGETAESHFGTNQTELP